jgi:hypothetical protein
MNTVLSFLALLTTFAIGLLGTLFDYVEKDEHEKRIIWKFGIPQPTGAGKFCLLLLVLSFGCSCYLTYRADWESGEQKSQLKQVGTKLDMTQKSLNDANTAIGATQTALDQAKAAIGTTQSTLNEANATINATQSTLNTTKSTLDTTKSILDTTKNALIVTQQQLSDMQAAAEVADLKTRGALVTIRSFWLYLFFLGNPQRQVDESVEAVNSGVFPKGVTLLEKLACDAPSDVTIGLSMPIADSPLLDEEVTASKNKGVCSVASGIATEGPNRTSVSPPYWLQDYLKDEDKIMLYPGKFTADILAALPGHEQLTAASFYTRRRASVSVSYDSASDADKIQEYFRGSLPRVIGYTTEPNEDPQSDLGVSKAFFLDRLLPKTPATPTNHMYYTYEPGPIGKDWPYFARKKTTSDPARQLANPYRAASGSTF